MVTSMQSYLLVLAVIVLYCCMFFEDSLYSAYMGKIEHNLAHLQSLTTNNPELASPFNQALCRKAELYKNSLKANKLSANNIIVNHRSLRISIIQPTGAHAEIVTSNVIKFILEGSVVGPESASHVTVAVSCDDVAAEVTRTPILTSNGLEYTVILKNTVTGAHKLDITATLPKSTESDTKGKESSSSRNYFASNSTIFFYLDEAIDNTASLSQVVVHSSKSILSQELSLQDLNETEVDRLLSQSVYGERITNVARNKHVTEPAAKGFIHVPGFGYKKGFHIVSPPAEGIIQRDLSVDVAVPILFVQRSDIRMHLIFDDRYFDVTDLMSSNTKMPHLDTHTAFLDLLQRDQETSVLAGDSSGSAVSLLVRPELLQYTGLFNFDLHGIDPGSHQLQLVVTLSSSSSSSGGSSSSSSGGVGEEVVVSFDAIRLHSR